MAYKNVFYYVDFLSKQPSLCVFNHTRYLTLFGAILSLIVVFVSFGFGLYFLINFFKRKDINIVSIRETSGFHNGFNLSDTLFMFYYDYTCTIPDDTDVDNLLQTSVLSLSFMNSSYNDPELSSSIDVKFERCSVDIIPERFRNKNFSVDIDSYYCISPGQNIIFDENDNFTNNLLFTALPCNAIFGHTNCKSESYIEQCYKQTSPIFELLIETDNTDHYNESYPIQPSTYKLYESKPPKYSIYDEVYFTVLNYETDTGYLFENIKKDSGIIVNPGRIKYSFDINENSPFTKPIIQFSFSMDKTGSEKYTRTYSKLQNIIADIGGMISLIQTIASMFIYLISENYLYVEIANNVLSVKETFYPTMYKSDNRLLSVNNNDSGILHLKSPHRKSMNIIADSCYFRDMKSNLNLLSKLSNEKPLRLSNDPSSSNVGIKYCKTKSKVFLSSKELSIIKNRQPLNLYERIKGADFFFFLMGIKSTKGAAMIALSEKVTKESLGCEQLIRNNIYLQKVISSMNDKQKDLFFNSKPEVLKEMEKKMLVISNIDKTRKNELSNILQL